jgi:hypothetical protein
LSYERARTEPSRCNARAIFVVRDFLSTDLLWSMELASIGCTTNAIELGPTDVAICEIGGDATNDRGHDTSSKAAPGCLQERLMISGAPHGQRRQNIQAAPEGQHYREAVESNFRMQQTSRLCRHDEAGHNSYRSSVRRALVRLAADHQELATVLKVKHSRASRVRQYVPSR